MKYIKLIFPFTIKIINIIFMKFIYYFLCIIFMIFSFCEAKAEEYVVARATIDHADALTGDGAKVLFIDTNNDKNNFEKIVLEFEENRRYNETINGEKVLVRQNLVIDYELDHILIVKVNEVFEHKPTAYRTDYYFVGPTTYIYSNSRTADVPYEESKLVRKGHTQKTKEARIKVNKTVYDYFIELLGRDLPVKTEEVTENGDANDFLFDLFGY